MDNNDSTNINANENNDLNMDVKSYEAIADKLKDIEEKISSDDIDMEESLKLYEEAVNLGMKASQTIESNVMAGSNSDEKPDEPESDGSN